MWTCLFFKVRCLRQIVLAGLGDHVARRISTDNMNTEDKQRLKYAYQVRIIPMFLTIELDFFFKNMFIPNFVN